LPAARTSRRKRGPLWAALASPLRGSSDRKLGICESGNEYNRLPAITIVDSMHDYNSEHAVESDAGHLADLFGTPLVVIDAAVLRGTMRRFRAAFARPPWRCEVVYAGKALMLQAIARIAHEEGLLLDVCSEGELQTVLRASLPASGCILHGCAKTDQELELAVHSGVRHIVIDHEREIDALNEIARRNGVRCPVLVRVNPGIAAATKSQIQTSAPGSKFGFPVQDGQALAAVQRIAQASALDFAGLHCHIGSQIFELNSYAAEIENLADFAALLARATGQATRILNVGGGLGVGASWARTGGNPGGIPIHPAGIRSRSPTIHPRKTSASKKGKTRPLMNSGQRAVARRAGLSGRVGRSARARAWKPPMATAATGLAKYARGTGSAT